MLKVRTVCLALLIPLLLDLLVFFAAQPIRDDSREQIRQGCEELQAGYRELEERSEEEEEEDELSFRGLLASSSFNVHLINFKDQEAASLQTSELPSWACGWKMPLRI